MSDNPEDKFPITECDCNICSQMCQSPCCGTPDDILKIIESGYADRLCLDNWPGQNPDIHPALKGFEGKKAPYSVSSRFGCTFWKEGKCELHEKGLKPLLGKVAYHEQPPNEWYEAIKFVHDSWNTEKGKEVIKIWKNKVDFDDR